MCNERDFQKTTDAIGTFSKGNESEPMQMNIEVCSCLCGDNTFAKVRGNDVWVICERVISDLDNDRAIDVDIDHAEHGI